MGWGGEAISPRPLLSTSNFILNARRYTCKVIFNVQKEGEEGDCIYWVLKNAKVHSFGKTEKLSKLRCRSMHMVEG